MPAPQILAIDAGNTHIVIGAFKDRQLLRSWRISTHPLCTGDELRVKFHGLFALDQLELKSFGAAVVSSVVPSVTEALRHAFEGVLPLHVIDSKWPFSFQILADPASQVGADRLVNAEAAVRDYGAPAIIIDSGTATTLCALTRRKEYLGGAIMPGMELSVEALARRAAKLFTVELVPPARAIGGNTEAALRSGILLGYASMIDGMVRRFKEELGEPDAKVIATGGISQRMRGIAKELTHFEPDLTLRGILYLYESISSR